MPRADQGAVVPVSSRSLSFSGRGDGRRAAGVGLATALSYAPAMLLGGVSYAAHRSRAGSAALAGSPLQGWEECGASVQRAS